MVRHLSPVRPKMHFNDSSQVWLLRVGNSVLLLGILKRSTPKKLLVSPWLQQWYKQYIYIYILVVEKCRGQVWHFGPKSSNPSLGSKVHQEARGPHSADGQTVWPLPRSLGERWAGKIPVRIVPWLKVSVHQLYFSLIFQGTKFTTHAECWNPKVVFLGWAAYGRCYHGVSYSALLDGSWCGFVGNI